MSIRFRYCLKIVNTCHFSVPATHYSKTIPQFPKHSALPKLMIVLEHLNTVNSALKDFDSDICWVLVVEDLQMIVGRYQWRSGFVDCHDESFDCLSWWPCLINAFIEEKEKRKLWCLTPNMVKGKKPSGIKSALNLSILFCIYNCWRFLL